ncbi:hypothetical protein Daus18300_004141 [Diaporthe australafricana]|uniref:Uncharacterized protein n=1 Tax=Diaporthe australafricana TaxID=127596 RepID=A0ABR3XBE6_9PEZI
MFQRLTVHKLAANFSLSLNDQMHHEEMETYIAEEMKRRKQTSLPGLFTDELEHLVKKQLLAGAQGMYLWVALQLDSIFPSQSRTVVTSKQIVNLINNLPKDLPEAFERALEEIIDDRYGNSIMKIVMAARSPLTLDELKVALTVVPGDPIWYAAQVPTDAPQLIALCGGNLLELDEEDGKIRFIHYSVVSHLLRATKNPRTMLYHFSTQEAEIQAGAICVTFLNMKIFGTDITLTKKITGDQLSERVIGTTSYQQPFLAHLAHHFKKRDQHRSASSDFDIGRLVAEIQAARISRFDPHCFQDYAVSNWLLHSRSFEKMNPATIEGPIPGTEFRYHLQDAAANSQTRKFLVLVRYGADASLSAFPSIGNIITRLGNRVLMARLKEIQLFGPAKYRESLDARSDAVATRD